MIDYEEIYGLAFDHAYAGDDGMEGEQVRFKAGIAAVIETAKRETLTDLLAQFPSHGLLGFKALIEKRLSDVENF